MKELKEYVFWVKQAINKEENEAIFTASSKKEAVNRIKKIGLLKYEYLRKQAIRPRANFHGVKQVVCADRKTVLTGYKIRNGYERKV